MIITSNPFISKYSAVISAVIYGLVMRLLFGLPYNNHTFSFTDLFSVTFIWIVPIAIGTVPMIFAQRQHLESSYRVISPVVSVLLFFIICFITRIEDLICIIIIALPFLTGAAIGGIIMSRVLLNYRDRKGIVYSILFAPFIFGWAEEQFKTPSQSFEVKTSVIVNAPPNAIWPNIVRVGEIRNQEYDKGVFNMAGIPRPLYAELSADTLGATRTGHFEGGLKFRERVNYWEKNKKVSFDIEVIPSSIRPTVFDQHMLKGGHFRFLNATYTITPLKNGSSKLALTSSYKLDTKINRYASFWGNWMLEDFQQRLLVVIKKRCDGLKP